MPAGNIQRTLHSFVSTVVSVNSQVEDNLNSNRTPQNSRRIASNGQWIVNELPVPSPASSQILHPRQSAAAELDFDLFDSYNQPQTPPQAVSPRSVQIRQVPTSPTEMIDNNIESELSTSYSGRTNTSSFNSNTINTVTVNNRNNVNFDVPDLQSPTGLTSIASATGVPIQQLQQILRGAAPLNPPSVTRSNNIQNSLRNKIVYKLTCTFCKIPVCNRAMRAILLADTKIELYSTDIPPSALVTMDEDRMTSGCNCRIRDTVCTGCGNVLGYHVSQPCEKCLDARNNGHFWMFCSDGVTPTERMHFDGNGPLYWASLSPMSDFLPASGYIPLGEQAGNTAYDAFCR